MNLPALDRHHIQRDGTSESQRRRAALDPTSVAVDERDVHDFLVFAQRLARQVVYYNLQNEPAGNWQDFFESDASVIIATIAKTNPIREREAVQQALEAPPHPDSLQQLFVHIARVARLLNRWHNGVGDATDFRAQIARSIRANLEKTLPRLADYHHAAAEAFPENVSFHPDEYQAFASVWKSDQTDPNLKPHKSLFGDATDPPAMVLAARDRLETLFAPLYRVLLKVIELAPRYFEQDLAVRSNVEPHLALFIAFLRIYLQVRDDANQLGRRHLDFFYEDVLGIRSRAAVPDQLHVVVQLAKQAAREHRIAAGTELDAGKDATGVPLRYRLDDDLIANKASPCLG